jgi:hypothetical protein
MFLEESLRSELLGGRRRRATATKIERIMLEIHSLQKNYQIKTK